MKKQVLVLISSLLFIAISFSSYAQSSSGGKISAKDAKVLKAMSKALKEGDFQKYSVLKSGVKKQINCLVPYVCETSTPIPLTPNGDWIFDSISWEAYKVTGVDGSGTITVIPFTGNPNIVSYDVLNGWVFYPDNIPDLENGQFVQIRANLKNDFTNTVDAVNDIVMFYMTPIVHSLVNATGSMCDGAPYVVSLSSSEPPVGPNLVVPTLMTYTKYILMEGSPAISTGDTLVGTGGQLDFTVYVAGTYSIKAINEPSPKLGAGDVCSILMSGSTTVTVNPLPVITASSNSEICTNETLNLLGGIPNPALLYSWTGPNGFTSPSQTTFITNASTAASGTYTLVGTIVATGCVDSAKTVVVVNPLPIIQLNSLTSTPCVNNALGEEYTTDLGMDNYVWTFPGSTVGTDYSIVSGSGTYKIYINWLTPGLKTIAVNYDTPAPAGCTLPSPKTITVTVNSLPNITKTKTDKESCLNSADTYSTETGMSGYNWVTSANGTIQAGTENTANAVITWTSGLTGTVTVSYVNNGCSSTSAPYIVTINPLPSATATNSGAACEGANITLTGGANGLVSYAWSGPNSYVSSTQSPVLNAVTVANAGSYTITVTDNKGCVNTAPTNVVVNAQPDATFTPDVVGAVCQGKTVKYTTQGAPNNSWDWTVVGGSIAAGGDGFNTVDVTWNNAAAPTKSVTVNYKNSPAGCMDLTPQVTNVVVNPLPTPSVLTGPTTPCVGSSTNVYTTDPGFGTTYVWTFPLGGGTIIGASNGSSITVQWNTAGPRSVVVQYDNASGCTGISGPYNVSVKPSPGVPSVSASPNPVCSGLPVTLTGTPATYTGYAWSGPDAMTNANARIATITSATTTGGNYKLVASDIFGCKDSATVIVSVNPLPTPTITSTNAMLPVCQGDKVTYTTDGAPNTNWDWTIVGGTISAGGDGSNTVEVTWSNAVAPNSITVSYMNATNCVASSPVYTIVVNPTPVPTLITPASVCAGSTATYTTDAGMQLNSYVWTIVGGTPDVPSSSNIITVDWGAINPLASISVHYVNPVGCLSTTKLNNLAIAGLPTPSIISSVPVTPCEGAPITYETQAGMSAYNWTVTAGGTPVSVSPFAEKFTVIWNTPGSQTVTVDYSNGCSGTPGSRTDNVIAKPVPSINSAGGTLCEGVKKVQYSTESGKNNYLWAITGGTITTSATTDNIEVTWNAGANNKLSVTYTEPLTNCAGTTENTYVVNAAPIPTLTDWDNIECVRIGAEPLRTYTTQSGGGISGYSWGIVGVNSGGIVGIGTDKLNVDWSLPTPIGVPDTIKVNYTNAAGCSAVNPAKYPVTVEARPVPAFTLPLPNPKACLGESVTYTAQPGFASYDWNVSAGGTIQSGENTASCVIKWNALGAQTVSVTYSSVAGSCPATAYTDYGVTVNDLPTTPIIGQGSVCTSSTTSYSAPAGSSGWNWVITGGFVVSVNTTSNTVTVDWPASVGTGEVALTYNDANGCRATVKTPITIGLIAVPSISGDLAVCVGERITYRTQAGMSNYVWTVNGGTPFAPIPSTADSIVIDWNSVGGAGVNNLAVTYTSPACAVANPVPVYGVNVSALPITETITPSKATVCQGDTITYSIPAGYSNILWSAVNGTPIGVTNSNTFKVLWSSVSGVNPDTVKVSYENASGCKPLVSPIVLPVTVNSLPTPSLTSTDTDVCFGKSGVYTTDVAPSGGYIWKVNNGTWVTGPLPNQITVTWDVVALTHSVEVNYPNANGCYALANTTLGVTVKTLPVPVITGSVTACLNAPNQSYTTSNASGITNWAWTISGGTIDSGQNTNSVSVTWTTTSNNWLTVSYDENSCTGTSIKHIVAVSDLPVNQTAITFPDGDYCANEAGVGIRLLASEPTVSYQLRNASDVLIGTVAAGTSPVEWLNVPAGTYSVVGVGSLPTSCARTVTTNIIVTALPLPSIYNVTPAGPVTGCNGGAGYTVGLDNSDTGFTYRLLLNGAVVGLPVVGNTGNPISFGPQTSFGTYTVSATNDITGCMVVTTSSFVMNSDVVTATYDLQANPASGSYCNIAGGGVDISLSDSEIGVDYILRASGVDIDTVAGTGNQIDFTRVTAADSYTIQVATLSGCRALMNGSVVVTPVAPPLSYTVEAQNLGFYCSGGGDSIKIIGQQAGIEYHLLRAGIPVDTVIGFVDNPTSDLKFSSVYTDGVYTVMAVNPLVAGCSVAMSNTVTVTANPLPTPFVVSSDGDFCIGSTTNINLSNTQSLTQYRLINIDDNSTSSWTSVVTGGSPISFSVNATGNYTIEASATANGITCSNWMQDTVLVTAQPLPSDLSITTSGGTSCNDGVVITVLSSQSGVTYSAIDLGTNTTPIATIVGPGDISFAPIVDAGKTYQVQAERNGCAIFIGTPISIDVTGVIVKQSVSGGGTICSGGSANISLDNTEKDVTYYLYLADSPGGTSSIPPIASLVGNADGSGKAFAATINVNGEYYVVGTAGSCINEMANRVTLSLNSPVDATIIVAPSATVCENTPVLFTGRGGDKYTFYLNNSPFAVAADSTLSLASVVDGDQIKVFVENTTTTCSAMSAPITMSVVNQLTPFTLNSVSGGVICPSMTDTLYLNSSQLGVNYILYNQLDAPIDTMVGNNGLVYFTGITTGDYYVIAELVGGSPCGVAAMNDTVTVAVAAAPTVFNLTPNGTENGCLGGAITLDGSDTGLTYQLIRNGLTVMADTLGTGVGLSFPKPLVAGTYTIQVLYGNGCIQIMNGSLQIINPPTLNIYALTATPTDGLYCNSGSSSGVALTLSNSDASITYSLMRDAISIKDTTAIGGPINFGSFTSEGYYSVQVPSNNGCFDESNVIHIVPVTPPTSFALQVDNGGSYCSVGGTGVGIQLVGQQDDVIYDLYLSGVVVGTAIGIDNSVTSTLPFVNTLDGKYLFTVAGSYSAVARYLTPVGCEVNMSSSVVVTPTAKPSSFPVTSNGDLCEGGATSINLNGSENNVEYRWVNITTSDALTTWVAGTGGLLQFGNITIAGRYVIEAQSTLGAQCATTLNDTVTINQVLLPHARNYSVVNGTTCSDASIIVVENAEQDVVYTLVDANTNVPTSISFVGSGAPILLDTMYIIDAGGRYFIQASRLSCSIRFPSSPVVIDINNADPETVKKHIVTPEDASMCNGDFGIKFGLQTNVKDVIYTLYRSDDNIKDATPQDTIDSFKGNGGINQQFKKYAKKTGFYYVEGVSASGTCRNYMSNDPELVVNPLPTAFEVKGSGMYCSNDPNPAVGGAIIGLDSQQDRVLYTLQQYDVNDDYVRDVKEVRGSNTALTFDFGSYKENAANYDFYKVVAIDTLTGCTSNMLGKVQVKLADFPPNAPIIDLGESNGRYCKGTNGAAIVINAPQPRITYQIAQDSLANDTIIFQKIALTTDPLTLGYVEKGYYHVTASWGGDGCVQYSTPFEITERFPQQFHVNHDCGVTDSTALASVIRAGRISMDSSERGITYIVSDALSNSVGFYTGIDTAIVFNGLYGPGTYTVSATCSASANLVPMLDTITIAFPTNDYSLTIKDRSSLTGVRGDTLQVWGNELDATYYARIENWVDTFEIGAAVVSPPVEFITDSSGIYHILAINDHNCGSIIGTQANILESMLVAVNDTLRFGENDLIGKWPLGLNDLMDINGIDKLGEDGNIVYRIINKGINTDLSLDSITGEFTYAKPPSYYGKDSIRYELVNKSIPGRRDTALVWIFIGNKPAPNGRTFLIPNAYSPNGDGINDYFVITTLFTYSTEESELEVYNRWGSLVYRSKDKSYDNKWNGIANANLISIGDELPNGTYFYIFKVTFNVDGVLNKEEYNGFIELRR